MAHGVYRTGIYGYGYIHGYPRKICECGYGYGWEISYPRQPCLFLPVQPSNRYYMVQMDFLAAIHVRIVGLCSQN